MTTNQRTGLIAFGIAGGLFLCAGGVVAVALVGASALDKNPGTDRTAIVHGKPRADREGETWTLNELRDYLERNGIPLQTMSSQRTDDGPQLYGYLTSITQHKDAKTAREIAGASRGGLAWGRFRFMFDADTIARIRALLSG